MTDTKQQAIDQAYNDALQHIDSILLQLALTSVKHLNEYMLRSINSK